MSRAPIGPDTVTVLGQDWPDDPHWWSPFDWTQAEVRSHALMDRADYHIAVPYVEPWAIYPISKLYRVRLKPGWKSFVQIDGEWHVSTEPAPEGIIGTPSRQQTIEGIIDKGPTP